MRLPIISDSYYGHWRDSLDLPTTKAQDDACLLLEAKGYKFLVDFGYENAIEFLGGATDCRFPSEGSR